MRTHARTEIFGIQGNKNVKTTYDLSSLWFPEDLWLQFLSLFTFHFSLSLFTYSQNVFSPFLSDAFLLRRITEDTDAVGASISLTLNVAVSSGLLIVVVTFVFTGLLVNKHTIKCQLWARNSPKSWINFFFNRISNEFTLKGIFTKAYSIKVFT